MKKALLEENLLCTPLKKLFQKVFGTNGEKKLEKPQEQKFNKSDTISPNVSIFNSRQDLSRNPKYSKGTNEEYKTQYNTEDEQEDDKWKPGLNKQIIEGGKTSYHRKQSEVANNKTYDKRENMLQNRNEKDAMLYNTVPKAKGPESIGYFIYIPVPADAKNSSPQNNNPKRKAKDDLNTAEIRRPSKRNNIFKHRLRDSKASLASSLENNMKPITNMLEPESKSKLEYVSSEPSSKRQYQGQESIYFRPTVLAPMSDSKEVLNPDLKSLDPTVDSFYRLKNIVTNDMVNKPINEEENSGQSLPSSLILFQESNMIKMIPQSKEQNYIESDLESGKPAMGNENNTKQSNIITTNTDMKEEESKPLVSTIDTTVEPNVKTLIEILSGQEKFSFKPDHDTAVSSFKSREPIKESDNTNYIIAKPEKMSSQASKPGKDTVSTLGSTESSNTEPIKINSESDKEEKFNPNSRFLESSLHFSTLSKNTKQNVTTPDHSENNEIIEPLKTSFDFLKQHHEPKPLTDIKIAKENKMPDTDLNSSIITLDFFLGKGEDKELTNMKKPAQVKIIPKHYTESPEHSFELPKDLISSKPIIMMPEYKENQALEPQRKTLGDLTDPLESTNMKQVKITQKSEKKEYLIESTELSTALSLKPNENTPLFMIKKPNNNEEILHGLLQSESKFNSSQGSIKIEPLNGKTVLELDSKLSESKFNSSQQLFNSNLSKENGALRRETQLSEYKLGSPLESIKSKLYKETESLETPDLLEPDLKSSESKLDQSLESKMTNSTIKNNGVTLNGSELSESKNIISPLEIVKSNPPNVKEEKEIDLELRRSKIDSSLESIKPTLLELKEGLGSQLEQSISMLKTSIDSFKSKSINSLQSIKSLKSIKSILGWTNQSNEENELNTDSKLDISIQSTKTKSLDGKEFNWKQSEPKLVYSHSTLEPITNNEPIMRWCISPKQNIGMKVDLEYARSKLDSSIETDSLKGLEVHYTENSESTFSILESVITIPNKEHNEMKSYSEQSESKKDISPQSIGPNVLEGSKGLKRLDSGPRQSEAQLNSSIQLIKLVLPEENGKVELVSEPRGSRFHSSLKSIKAIPLEEKEVFKQSRSALKISQVSVKSNTTEEEKALDHHLESTGSKLDSTLESISINPSQEVSGGRRYQVSTPSKSKTASSVESKETKSLGGIEQEYYSKQSISNSDSSPDSLRINSLNQNEGLKLYSEATRSKLSLLESVKTNPSEKEGSSLELIRANLSKQNEGLEIDLEYTRSKLDPSLESNGPFEGQEVLEHDSENSGSKFSLLESMTTNPNKENGEIKTDSEPSESKQDISLQSIGTNTLKGI